MSDHDAFNTFIDVRWGGDLNGTSLEEALQEFREYQREQGVVQLQIAEALHSSTIGESRPLNDIRLNAIFKRRDAELRKEGIED